jgi:Protein of unknown function (DUF3386)
MRPIAVFAATLCLAFGAASARAHFLFVRICPPAEGGRVAEVYFSEYATAGDPRFIDKVAAAEFSIQTTPGEFRPLPLRKLSDRLRAHVPVDGTLMVAGRLDYGVLNRPGSPPFLLRHYSKAVAGTPDEVNRLAPKATPLEIVARFEMDQVVLTVLLDAKPLPKTKINTVDALLANEELETDADGRAVFKPDHPGTFCVYASHVNRTPGEQAGHRYDEIREFATLSFAWPLAPSGADDEAVSLFEEALASRAAWHDFPGFTAEIAGDVEGRPFSGKVAVDADGGVKLDIDEGPFVEWVQDQLESITMHRAAGQQRSPGDPKPVLRFADEQPDHPLGRLLAFEGGHFASSYRVKDKQITTVNRVIDGQNMTITVLGNAENAEGKFLPRSYTVQYWDEATGGPLRTETVQDRWTRVGRFDLPERHTVTTASPDGFSVKSFRLLKHELTSPPAR